MKIDTEVNGKEFTITISTTNGRRSRSWRMDSDGEYKQITDIGESGGIELSTELRYRLYELEKSLVGMSKAMKLQLDDKSNRIVRRTVDGRILECGDNFYGMGKLTKDGGDFEMVPVRHEYPQDDWLCGDNIFFNRDLCQKQCDVENTKL